MYSEYKLWLWLGQACTATAMNFKGLSIFFLFFFFFLLFWHIFAIFHKERSFSRYMVNVFKTVFAVIGTKRNKFRLHICQNLPVNDTLFSIHSAKQCTFSLPWHFFFLLRWNNNNQQQRSSASIQTHPNKVFHFNEVVTQPKNAEQKVFSFFVCVCASIDFPFVFIYFLDWKIYFALKNLYVLYIVSCE